jgi:hypothetical protein
MPGGTYTVNNIIDGDLGWSDYPNGSAPYNELYTAREGNLYTGYSWLQTEHNGWTLRASEIYQPNQSSLFNDYLNEDYTTKAGSQGINAGVNISFYLAQARIDFPDYNFSQDINGNPRVSNGNIDIGPYEYQQGSANSLSLLSAISNWWNGLLSGTTGKAILNADVVGYGNENRLGKSFFVILLVCSIIIVVIVLLIHLKKIRNRKIERKKK